MSDNSEDITIERCPVCRSDEPIVYESHKGGFYVQCECCDMRGPRKDNERAAILVWNSLHRTTLRWTAKPPTEPGWYWHRRAKEDTPLPVRVENVDDCRPGYQWAGPITEPEEKK